MLFLLKFLGVPEKARGFLENLNDYKVLKTIPLHGVSSSEPLMLTLCKINVVYILTLYCHTLMSYRNYKLSLILVTTSLKWVHTELHIHVFHYKAKWGNVLVVLYIYVHLIFPYSMQNFKFIFASRAKVCQPLSPRLNFFEMLFARVLHQSYQYFPSWETRNSSTAYQRTN